MTTQVCLVIKKITYFQTCVWTIDCKQRDVAFVTVSEERSEAQISQKELDASLELVVVPVPSWFTSRASKQPVCFSTGKGPSQSHAPHAGAASIFASLQ